MTCDNCEALRRRVEDERVKWAKRYFEDTEAIRREYAHMKQALLAIEEFNRKPHMCIVALKEMTDAGLDRPHGFSSTSPTEPGQLSDRKLGCPPEPNSFMAELEGDSDVTAGHPRHFAPPKEVGPRHASGCKRSEGTYDPLCMACVENFERMHAPPTTEEKGPEDGWIECEHGHGRYRSPGYCYECNGGLRRATEEKGPERFSREASMSPASPNHAGENARNMYGVLPCPKCGSNYRAAYKVSGEDAFEIACDDCGLKESATSEDAGHTWNARATPAPKDGE